MGAGCKLVQFVVFYVLFVMMLTNFVKKFSSFKGETCLDGFWFFSGRKLGQPSADQELLKSLYQNKTPDFRLKYILIQVHAPAGSVVRIKKKRPEEKKTVQINRKQRRRESNPVYLQVQATP